MADVSTRSFAYLEYFVTTRNTPATKWKPGFIVHQFYSRTCKCELISETGKALIALNYCYSLITLNGAPPKISFKCLLLIQRHRKMKYSKSGI